LAALYFTILKSNMLKRKANILDDEGRNLPIMEYFLSIQGEGYHSGLASFFIRLGGCDVGCHWCDVKESWNPDLHPLLSVDEVIEKIPNHIKTVIVTGGEPTNYNLDYLTRKLKEKNKEIHLETSGTSSLTGVFDWICLSPKKNELPKNIYYKIANELKVIVFDKTDYKFAEQQAEKIKNNFCRFYLQPEWSKKEKIITSLVQYIEKFPKWKLSLQSHKYINIP